MAEQLVLIVNDEIVWSDKEVPAFIAGMCINLTGSISTLRITDVDSEKFIAERSIELRDISPVYYQNNHYYLWVKSYPGLYDLYRFDSRRDLNDFIRGLIQVTKIFEEDFRDYLAGKPLHYSDNKVRELNVEGYDIRNKYLTWEMSGYDVPYFSMAYEDERPDYE